MVDSHHVSADLPGLVITILGVQYSTLHVQLRLQQRRAVDRVGRSASRGEGRLGLGTIACCPVAPTLQQVHLSQDHLIVELLQFSKEGVDQSQSWREVIRVDVAVGSESAK